MSSKEGVSSNQLLKGESMVVGIPKEVKDNEFRVALTPLGVKNLVALGQEVLLENGAGEGSGFLNREYQEAGAKLIPNPDTLFKSAELILKVKEPQPEEYGFFHKDHILFTYLHLAASKSLTQVLVQSGCTALAYEMAQDSKGRFPDSTADEYYCRSNVRSDWGSFP